MKHLWIFLSIIALTSCSGIDDQTIAGKWKTNDPHYSATYQFDASKNGFEGRVLSYNDGTTIQKNNQDATPFVSDLKLVNGVYSRGKLDARIKERMSFKLIHRDTLKVTKNYRGIGRTETWTRIK